MSQPEAVPQQNPPQPAKQPPARPHISPTQLESYSGCGERYRRRYIEKEIIPPGVSAAKGKGMHKGAQVNMAQKIESHQDLSASDIIDASVAEFERSVATDGVLFLPEEEARGKQIVLGEAKDQTVKLATAHSILQAPQYQPVATEMPVTIPLPEVTHDLFGVVDLFDDQRKVTDFKTASKKKSQSDADASIQLTFYAAAIQYKDGQPAAAVQLDTLVQKSKGIDRQVMASARGPADFQVLANRVNVMLHGLKQGVFIPASPGSWWCYGMDTDLLCKVGGWRRGHEVNAGELVASYDTLTGCLSWQPVLAAIRKPWGGPMVEYDGRGLKFKVTPDHRMLIRSMGRGRWRTVLADSLVGKGSICYPVSAYMDRPGVRLSDDEIALSGWLCAEGHFEEGSAAVCLYQKPTGRHYREIHDLLGRLGYEYNTWDHDDASKMRIAAVCGRLVRDKIQRSKSIPQWLWEADARQFQVWLAAFLKGDGHEPGTPDDRRNWVVSQKDEGFIDELQGLCAISRISAVKSEGRRRSTSGGMFCSLSGMDGVTERITESAKAGTHFVESTESEVWCVTVPTGYVLTRYRGRPLIAGNCSPKWCGYFHSCPLVNAERVAAAEKDEG